MKWSNDDFSWFLSLLKTKLLELGRTDDQNNCGYVHLCVDLY